MRKIFLIFLLAIGIISIAQEDSLVVIDPIEETQQPPQLKLFHSQKLINTKTVELLKKNILEFNVSHNFGDIAGDFGGIERFFGLDAATDIRIGFQYGLSDRFNLIASRTKGAGSVQQQWELGIKWQLLQQSESTPLSLTIFANDVISSQKSGPVAGLENSYEDFWDRHSQFIQLMAARKFGGISLQLSPALLHTNHVIPGDDVSIFALGGGVRLPITKKIVLLADYFHPFRSEESERFFETQQVNFHDPFGIGIEILTEGHVFHINFTNSTEILENRFLRRTVTAWEEGQYRWAFTISRNFVLGKKKRSWGP